MMETYIQNQEKMVAEEESVRTLKSNVKLVVDAVVPADVDKGNNPGRRGRGSSGKNDLRCRLRLIIGRNTGHRRALVTSDPSLKEVPVTVTCSADRKAC